VKFSLSELMLMAIAEGDKARLHAPPNPWVGAVIVDARGVIVGEGHTQAPGESHAEIAALRRAGAAARGATMVVTLEPCCHVGRTGLPGSWWRPSTPTRGLRARASNS
jgi:diaminohydroxyphosphoribosylaminopyrimidine deaminase/5-amino-6-(5-phosphoribosylamino)uracil reductase